MWTVKRSVTESSVAGVTGVQLIRQWNPWSLCHQLPFVFLKSPWSRKYWPQVKETGSCVCLSLPAWMFHTLRQAPAPSLAEPLDVGDQSFSKDCFTSLAADNSYLFIKVTHLFGHALLKDSWMFESCHVNKISRMFINSDFPQAFSFNLS